MKEKDRKDVKNNIIKKSSSVSNQSKLSRKFTNYAAFLKGLLSNNLFWWFLFAICFLSTFFWLKNYSAKHTAKYFSIKKIEFDGNEQVPEVLLLKASKLRYKDSIFAIPIHEVKNRLEKISWVKSVVIQRKLPNKISIRIAERTPIAIFQSKGKLHLVDSDGVILDNDGIGNFSNLPIIAGKGAEKEVSYFLDCIDKYPKIKKQLVFAIRIGERRWDIRINKGIIVKLPERGLMQAFGILDEISDSNGFFNDDIAYLDLRLPDRIIIRKK